MARYLATRSLTAWAIMLSAACGGPVAPRAGLFLAPAAVRSPLPAKRASADEGIEVTLDVRMLDADMIELALGPSSLVPPIAARLVERARRGPDDFSWYGRIATGGIVMLDVKAGAVTGIVETDNARYVLASLGNGRHVLVPRPRSPAAFRHPDSFKDVQGSPGKASACSENTGTSRTIELLIGYTPAARQGAQDHGHEIERLVEHSVFLANETNRASRLDVEVTFHLARQYLTTDGERGTMDDTLIAFQSTDDDVFKEVHILRDATAIRADICVIVIRGEDESAGGTTHVIGAAAPEAFTIVDHRYLDEDVLAHEVGHLMSLRHTSDTNPQPCREGHGFRHDGGPTDTWATIMTDDCGGQCSLLRQWSNPNVPYHGSSTGVSGSSNSAAVLTATSRAVAQFR